MAIGKQVGKLVSLTDGQGTRPTATGFGEEAITAAERGPNYGSLAATANGYPAEPSFKA